MIKNIKDLMGSGYYDNPIINILMKENNLNPEEFEKNFPDYNYTFNKDSIFNYIKNFERLLKTNDFINEIEEWKKSNIKKIRILGDNDVDGMMATTIMILTLKEIGFDVDFDIPNRLTDAFAFSKDMIGKAISEGIEAFISVDNGISSKEEVDYALSMGKKFIITDHHLPNEGLVPENVLIIDPSYNGDSYSGICGATVAMKLSIELLKHFKLLYKTKITPEILFFAAAATVADMMPAIGENRLLLKSVFEYVDHLKNRNNWHGRILKMIAGLGGNRYLNNPNRACNYDLFKLCISPVGNSISRINGDVSPFINKLIECDNKGVYIKDFIKYNITRKNNLKILEHDYEESTDNVDITILNQEDYDFPIKGLVGLLSNKMMNKNKKPTFIGYLKDGMYEFSGRSFCNYSIHDAIERIKKNIPELGLDGGGHAVSMGVRFPASENNLLIFREAINADFELNKNNDEELDDDVLYLVDPDMMLNVFNTICQFKLFGYGFAQPKFYTEGKIESVINEKINNQETTFIYVNGQPFITKNKNLKANDFIKFTFEINFDNSCPAFKVLDLNV